MYRATSKAFQNLTDEEIQDLYEQCMEKGMSEEDAFDYIYNIDCELDGYRK